MGRTFNEDERPTSNEKTSLEAGKLGSWEFDVGWVERSPWVMGLALPFTFYVTQTFKGSQ